MVAEMLIGLAGAAGAGKDAAGHNLVRCAGATRLAFADPLKDMAAALLKTSTAELEALKPTDTKILGNLTARELLQQLGTEVCRNIDQNFWLNVMAARLARAQTSTNYFGAVITDARFDNEARWIRQRGGITVLITRSDAAPAMPHSSESGIDPLLIDAEIDNSGSLCDLYREINRVWYLQHKRMRADRRALYRLRDEWSSQGACAP